MYSKFSDTLSYVAGVVIVSGVVAGVVVVVSGGGGGGTGPWMY